MNRKQMSFYLIVFLLFSTTASAQQPVTKADIKVLETKITSLENSVKDMDKRLTNQISELDKRLTNQISESDKRLTNQIDELDKRLTVQIKFLFWAIGALITIVLAVIVLPQVFGYFKDRQERANLRKMIDDLRQQNEQQQREIEELRRQFIVPSQA